MSVPELVLTVHSCAHGGLEEVGGAYVLLQYCRYPLVPELTSGGMGRREGEEVGVRRRGKGEEWGGWRVLRYLIFCNTCTFHVLIPSTRQRM